LQRRSYYFLLFVIAMGALAAVGFTKFKTVYGLDIKGGTRLTYQVKLLKDQQGKIALPKARSQIISVLLNRASGMAAEPVVVAKGEDQVVVELPGISDINAAREVIGSSARIELYHARNLNSAQDTNRAYDEVRSDDPNTPVVKFRKRGDGKLIEPGTAEYKSVIQGWYLILAGTDLAAATAQPAGQNSYQPAMEFNNDGTRKMSQWMDRYYGKEEPIAFVMDGRVLSVSPVMRDARITSNAFISGEFSTKYVTSLVSLLNGGSLPAELEELSSSAVSPTIGDAAYGKMVTAGAIAFGIISLYLIGYYAFPGVVALCALCLYTLFTLTALKFIGATFSLAAIAGFILSVGMAVDANILVFERFKEEMRNGRPLMSAMEIGFKRALPAIIDSNACTILTSLVLANIGTGPVKGFATTLIIGVAISLFTAVTVTRSLLIFLVGSGIGNDPKWYAVDRDWFKKYTLGHEILPILQKWKKWFAISVATVLIGLVFVPLGGFKFNVELQGGTEAQFLFKGDNTTASIGEGLEKAGFKGSTVKFGEGKDGNKLAIISVPDDAFKGEKDPGKRTQAVLAASGLQNATDAGSTTVGPTLQREVQVGAATGVGISILLIIAYLALRFGFSVGGFKEGLKFGLSAIGALLHDILVVVFMAALFGYFFKWDISSLFLTAMLTIIGFSVHDTIIVFDRIRENLRHQEAGEDIAHLMNRSITQTFSRSINTSGTVIVTLLILVLFGTPTPDLKFFVVTMLIGIVSGTYSSIYNASPILYLWDKSIVDKKGEKAGLVGLARAEMARSAQFNHAPQSVPRAQANVSEGGRSYGQVRRRAKDTVKDSWQELD
jgi:SecD/SecF fusion protein